MELDFEFVQRKRAPMELARDFDGDSYKDLAPTERKRLDFRRNHPFDAPNVCSRRRQSLLTEHELLLGADVRVKPCRSQSPSRPIKSAHQFPDQAGPVILNR